jgi:hypothetical protein
MLMQNGAATLYYQTSLFERDLGWLADHGYVTHRVDCGDLGVFHADMSQALQFRQQYGHEWTGNLDGFNDAIFDLEFGAATGVTLGFLGFDRLFAAEPARAIALLDVIECNSRFHLLTGNRLLALVQTNDSTLAIPELGGRSPAWNSAEFLAYSRRPSAAGDLGP